MFKKTMVTMIGALALLVSSSGFSANTSLIVTDYAYDDGIGNVMYDSQSNINWLNLSHTDGMSFIQSLQLTQNGGSLYGWRIPTVDEFKLMASELMGISFEQAGLGMQSASVDSKIEWNAFFTMTYDDRSMGYVERADGTISIAGMLSNDFYGSGYSNYNNSWALPHYGTFLVKDGFPNENISAAISVPEPAAIALMGISLVLMGLYGARRNRRKS